MSVVSIVGGPGAVAGASAGRTYVFNNINATTNTLVAPGLAMRRKITFINPSGTVIVYVSMVNAFDFTQGTTFTFVPTLAALGGTIPVFPGGMVVIDGDCQRQWQALAASGTANPFTVLDSLTS